MIHVYTGFADSNMYIDTTATTLTFSGANNNFGGFLGVSAVWDGVSTGGTVCLVTHSGGSTENCYHDVAFSNI